LNQSPYVHLTAADVDARRQASWWWRYGGGAYWV